MSKINIEPLLEPQSYIWGLQMYEGDDKVMVLVMIWGLPNIW